VIFIPLGGIELLADDLQEPLTHPEAGFALVAAGVAAALGSAAAALLGEVVYAGIVAAMVTGERAPSVGALLRHLPLLRLIAVDLVWVLVVAAGLIAVVVPGFVFMTWFALVAPAVEIEGHGVRASFRRSHELVRRRFWLVFWLIIPVLVGGELLAELGQSLSFWGLGEGWLADWTASVIANLIASPPYALVAVILFLGLRDHPGRAQAASV